MVLEMSYGSFLSHMGRKGQIIKHCSRWPERVSTEHHTEKYNRGENSWSDTDKPGSQEELSRSDYVVILPLQWAAEQIRLQLEFAGFMYSVMLQTSVCIFCSVRTG